VTVKNGLAQVPTGPGLGVNLVMDRVAAGRTRLAVL
jgi:L-alanine-DL-glutamate epimerase-like enolase superfamily enzyme